MALNVDNLSTYKITAGFNSTFSEIVNTDFLQPTYDDWFTNDWQFLQKREWWTELFYMTWEVLDYYKYWEYYYVLVKTNTTDCTLWKVVKDINNKYTIKTDITPAVWIKYLSSNNKWVVNISSPDLTSIKVSNSTPTNTTDPTTNPNWEDSVILKDTVQSFDGSYYNTIWVITSHSEYSVISMAIWTPPSTPAVWDKYVIPWWATWAWSWLTGKVATWSWSSWTIWTPSTWWFVDNKADSKTYRCAVTAWPTYTWTISPVNNWYKEWTRFTISAVLDRNQLRITSPVSINNYDSYSIYWVLSSYKLFKKSWNVTSWKVWVDPLTDSVQIFSWFLNTVDLESFDWYLFGITPSRVYRKDSWQELVSTTWLNFFVTDTTLTCMKTTWDFIVIWWTSKCYALIRILQSSTWDFTYSLRDLTELWLFSKKSVLTYAWSLYTFLSDKRWYWVSVSFTAQTAQVQLKDVWLKVQKYFDKIAEWDEVEWFWFSGKYWFVSTGTYNAMVMYDDQRQWFVVHEYAYWFNGMKLNLNTVNSQYWTRVFLKWWDLDYDSAITERIAMIWPADNIWLPHRQYMLRIMFWYVNEVVNFRVNVYMDNEEFFENIVFDPNKTYIVNDLSSLWDWTLGSTLLWYWLLWSWEDWLWSKFWIIWLRLWKIGHITKVVITNLNNSNLVFARLDMVYWVADQRLVAIKDVM